MGFSPLPEGPFLNSIMNNDINKYFSSKVIQDTSGPTTGPGLDSPCLYSSILCSSGLGSSVLDSSVLDSSVLDSSVLDSSGLDSSVLLPLHIPSMCGTPRPSRHCRCCAVSTPAGCAPSASALRANSCCQWAWTQNTPSPSGSGRKVGVYVPDPPCSMHAHAHAHAQTHTHMHMYAHAHTPHTLHLDLRRLKSLRC